MITGVRVSQSGCWRAFGVICRPTATRAMPKSVPSQEKPKASLAAAALSRIQALYRIEQESRTLVPTERQRVRAARSQPLLDELRLLLDQHLPIMSPRCALGKAMPYAHKRGATSHSLCRRRTASHRQQIDREPEMCRALTIEREILSG